MIQPRTRAFTVLMGALAALTALSIDMSLPALPALRTTFHVSASHAQLTLTLFLIGYALSQLVSGPMSDVKGRKLVLLGGLALFTLSGFACALSTSMTMLVLCRFLQGIGAGVGPVLSRAIVRDTFERQEATGVFSQITQVMIVAPMVAPSIGSYLLTQLSWRAIFLLLGLAGVIVGLICLRSFAEPMRHNTGGVFKSSDLRKNYGRFLADRVSVGNMLIICSAYSGMFAYVSGSSFVFIEVFGVAQKTFGYFFAIPAGALLIGATVNKALVTKIPSHTLLNVGIFVSVIGAALLVMLSWWHVGGIIGVLVTMSLYLFGFGIVVPHAMSAAMAPFPEMAGVVSSLIGCLQTLGGSIAGYCVAAFYHHSSISMATTVAVMAMAMLVAYFFVAVQTRFERLVLDPMTVSEPLEVE